MIKHARCKCIKIIFIVWVLVRPFLSVTTIKNPKSRDSALLSKLVRTELGVVHILRNQQMGGGGFQMLTVDYGGGEGVGR